MRFWDTSALVPLFVEGPMTTELRTWTEDDDVFAAWVLSDVELRSGMARLSREGSLTLQRVQEASARVDANIQTFAKLCALD